MEKGNLVKDMSVDMEISGIYIVVNPSMLSSRNGSYWRLWLADATGSIEGKIWPPKSLNYPELPGGQPVEASGRCVQFREQLQIRVENLRYLSEEEKLSVDRKDFLPVSKRDIDEMYQELRELCLQEFQHAPWRKLFLAVMDNEEILSGLKYCPAAKNIHHAWTGGLLEHTLSVAKLCLSLADLYPELDRQTLLAGAIFHDLGKIREFSSGFSIEYTDEGCLQGHGYLGLEMLFPYFAKCRLENHLADHLKHLILSHHGLPEYGAARTPQTKEAFILHFADNIDAKMTQCKSIFENEKVAAGNWSAWQKSIEGRLFNALPTPLRNASQNKSIQEEICLSLLKE